MRRALKQKSRTALLYRVKGTAIFLLLLLVPLQLYASEARKLHIATTFPEEFAQVIGGAFERRHPDIDVDFSFRATTGLIEHLTVNDRARADLVWMSSPVGIRELAQNGLLADDPADCIFAYSRFGVMWREDMLAARAIAAPESWRDLALPRYRGEVGISSPSRSGTMAIFVEAVLQSEGWARGWAQIQEIGGSLATITARSIGVREGLLHGRFSVGVGVDFLAKTIGESQAPVRFLASPAGVLLPASACVLRRAERRELAKAFKDFLRSDEGQALLSHPLTQRISLEEGRRALAGTSDTKIFDTGLAERRRALVAVLFDQLITYRQEDLRAFWAAWHDADALLLASTQIEDPGRAEIVERLAQARTVAGAVSVPDFMTDDLAFTSIFKLSANAVHPSEVRGIRQRLAEDWLIDSRNRLRAAGELIATAREMIDKSLQPSQPAGQ
jgi:phosphoglycerate transport regulatory protein PgtC